MYNFVKANFGSVVKLSLFKKRNRVYAMPISFHSKKANILRAYQHIVHNNQHMLIPTMIILIYIIIMQISHSHYFFQAHPDYDHDNSHNILISPFPVKSLKIFT
jgi:hypothetical protein